MNKRRIQPVSLEGANILPGIFKNFSGKPGQYNPSGTRTFCVELDRATADMMAEAGWNVKQLDPRDEGDEPVPYIQVKCRFENVPPTIYMLTGRNNKKTRITEDTVDLLDSAMIEWADLTITPYAWEMKTKNGVESGVAAYLKTMYVKVAQDEFAEKYNDDIPEEVPFN